MFFLSFFATFITAYLLSIYFIPIFRKLSFKWGILDYPKTQTRKNHQEPTPLLGGVVVFTAFFLTVTLAIIVGLLIQDSLNAEWALINSLISGIKIEINRLLFIFVGGLLILLLGLKDDCSGMNPMPKILLMVGVSLLLFSLNIRITLFIGVPLISFLLTIGWLVSLTNSFNLLDNMNGLSSGVAITTCLNSFLVAWYLEQYFICFYLIVFIGALFGFFQRNFAKGDIFLGDNGALFIGYNLAVITILESFFIQGVSSNIVTAFTPLFIFSLPFYDTLSVIIIRIKNQKPIYVGDLNHISHRIARSGWSKKQTVFIVMGISLFTGLISLFILNHLPNAAFTPAIFFLTLQLLIYLFETFIKRFKRQVQ